MKRNILREYVRMLKGNLLDIDFEHIENILQNLSRTKGISIPGLNLTFHKGFIFPHDLSIPDYSYTIQSTGMVKINEIEGKIKIESIKSYKKPPNNLEIIVPFFNIKFPLTIRNPNREDRYIKMNASFNQKVFEMIRISGIPSELRHLCPVIINGNEEMIWVVGSPISESFKTKNKKDKHFTKISYQIEHVTL